MYENTRSLSNFRLRGRVFRGVVSFTGMQNIVKISRKILKTIPILNVNVERTYKNLAYLPREFQHVQEGDIVSIAEVRKISKLVSFVVYALRSNQDRQDRNHV